jgi:hypothetical protein
MGVESEWVLHAVADIAIVAPAVFEHLVAEHRIGLQLARRVDR